MEYDINQTNPNPDFNQYDMLSVIVRITRQKDKPKDTANNIKHFINSKQCQNYCQDK